MKIIIFIGLIFVCFSCAKDPKAIARLEDYKSSLVAARAVANHSTEEELSFWAARLKLNPDDEASLLKIAALQSELFKSTGRIEHIVLSDSMLHEVLHKYPKGNVEVYQKLSANAIAQHKFIEAKIFAEKALALNDKKSTSLLLLVDASLELGDYAQASKILRDFTNQKSFAFLIRKAKLLDHEGSLDSAITCMERAYERVKGNKTLSAWTLSNLGDMYGHAGRIDDSYQTYLKVLAKNPDDDYVLKGIAWIALSHDQNTTDAKNIVNVLAERRRMPEAHLLLSEIAALEGRPTEASTELQKFKVMVSDSSYSRLYAKYLATLEAEEFQNTSTAIEIATQEIKNRPTPESYDLLAWSYYHDNQPYKAMIVANRYVEHQTFEPDALYHLGMIYLANKENEKAWQYLSAALNSRFELGPIVAEKIEASLRAL